MKLTAISFLFLLVIPLVSAISFDFNFPDSVNLNDNFTVNINATTSEIYDVKIFVQNNQTEITISDIYNNGWKNPYYYIKSVFPEQSIFLVRVKNYSDDAAICVRLRKTGSSSYSEGCDEITVIMQQDSEQTPSEEDNSDIPEEILSSSSEQFQDFIPAEDNWESSIQYNQDSPEKIYLTPKKSSKESFISSEEKLRNYILYFFMAILIILCIYLAFKKL